MLLLAPLASGETAAWDELSRQAQTLFEQGRLADAEAAMRQALDLVGKRYGEHDVHVVSFLGNLAFILKAEGKLAQAEALYLPAMPIIDKLPPGDVLHGQSLRDLAQLYVAEHKLAEAEQAYRRLIEWQLAYAKAERGDLANAEGALANVYLSLGRKDDAERMMRRSFDHAGEAARANGMIPPAARSSPESHR